ncbi:MAG: BlaI/MecI/CopY family transcriptional regulator [Candidatus Woesearchaeota archaeon]|nr:BlaI/MecI/CopY family transcriptional regulator [Candidatus Woesearchaeota archaeon]
MDTELFQEIGLTRAEAKVYVALLRTGQTSAGALLRQTGLQNSTLHKTLHKLVQKGFASYILKGKRHIYHAADPETILKFINEKQRRFEHMLPELKLLQKPVEKQEAEVFEGFKGFKNMLQEVIKDGEPGDEYLFFSFYTENPDDFDNVYAFYKEFEKERAKRGIITKGVAPSKIKEKFKGRKTKNIVFVDTSIPLNISIFKNKVILTPWEERQISFLIHSAQLAESFRKYFFTVWEH